MSGSSMVDGDVVAIVRRFVSRPDLPLDEVHTSPLPTMRAERTFATPDHDASFVVGVEDGQVLRASMPIGLVIIGDASADSVVTLDRAYTSARTFLFERVVRFDGMELFLAITDDGEEDEEGHVPFSHRLQWGQWLGSKRARGPQWAKVSVDGMSGSLLSFTQGPSVPITVDVEPTIQREEALAIARRHFGLSVMHSTLKLQVSPYPSKERPHQQMLWWDVQLTSEEPISLGSALPRMGVFHIDAHSGTVFHSYVEA